MSDFFDEIADFDEPGDRPREEPAPPAPPRVWTVFVACCVALFVSQLAQAIVIAVVIGFRVAGGLDLGKDPEQFLSIVTEAPVFISLALAGQLVFGAVALLAAWYSPQAVIPRLGLERSGLSFWKFSAVVVGSLVPLTIGISLAHLLALVIPPDPSVQKLYEQMTWAWAGPFVLFIALAPGLMEELLFRGYMQRRLLERWRPRTAILATSLIFAAAHVVPHAVANAFVIGLYLGVVAWRTGSIWPSVACHAFVNGAWNVWNLGIQFGAWPETPPLAVIAAFFAVTLACFGYALWTLLRQQTPDTGEPLSCAT